MSKGARNTLIAFGIIILTAIIVVRLYLDVWLLDYVNKTLNQIAGYEGSVQSINIDLYRGAYKINNLVLNKKTGKIPVPFLSLTQADLSIQWSALLHGRVVSSVKLYQPVINFAVKDNSKQTGAQTDWTTPVKNLAPIDINEVSFDDGKITYQDFSSNPKVDIYIHHMHGDVHNLRNVVDKDQPLPSTILVEGSSIGDGQLKLAGRMNILKPIPDIDYGIELVKAKLSAINTYTDAYAAFNFAAGDLDFYSQIKIKNNNVDGYVKLLAHDVSVNILKHDNPLETVWSAIVAGVIEIFTNHSEGQFAAKADLQGTLDNINADPWSTLGSIVQNAFVEALSKGLDNTGQGNIINNLPPARKTYPGLNPSQQ